MNDGNTAKVAIATAIIGAVGGHHQLGANAQVARAVVTGTTAVGYTRRVYGGCTTILGVDYELIAPDRMTVRAQGSGCDLHDHVESYTYSKVK